MGNALAVQVPTYTGPRPPWDIRPGVQPGVALRNAIRRERQGEITGGHFRSRFSTSDALASLFAPSRWAKMRLVNPDFESIIPCLTFIACQTLRLRSNHSQGKRVAKKVNDW